MRNGLESTIKYAVKQSLAGESPSAIHGGVSTSSNRGNHVEKPTAVVNGISEQQLKLAAATQETTPMDVTETKIESSDATLTDSQDAHGKSAAVAVNAEPMTSERIEKLLWKHKCEIEAIKHNAGK